MATIDTADLEELKTYPERLQLLIEQADRHGWSKIGTGFRDMLRRTNERLKSLGVTI